MRILLLFCVIGAALLWPVAGAHAQAVYHGNDTGGIISWSPENERHAHAWAIDYCNGWGKFARITGVRRQYGDYISFNCLWNPKVNRFALPEVRVRAHHHGCRVIHARVEGRMRTLHVC
jgi:hypothetical protein